MRLASVRWKGWGIDTEEQMRERSDFRWWLVEQGAQVQMWMLGWKVFWR